MKTYLFAFAILAGCGVDPNGGHHPGPVKDMQITFPEFDFAMEERDLTTVFNRDAACAQVAVTATPIKRPIDVIFVIDNSGSMTDEIIAIQNNINMNFAQIIAASGLDYRVIMLTRHGDAQTQQSVCISKPLSGAMTCNPLPPQPVNTQRFKHYSIEIASTDSFQRILSSYAVPDEFNLAPNGWGKDYLRPTAVKEFIEITDDNSNMTFANFEPQLFALDPKGIQFGKDAKTRNYVWNTIAGLHENNPPTKPWEPKDPEQNALCTNGGGAVANGIEYQRASIATGGLRFPICEHASFDTVFKAVAQGVIKGSQISCEFELPPPPMGQNIDLATVVVEYTPGDGTMLQTFPQVASGFDCMNVPDGFFIANNHIFLCPQTCSKLKMDFLAKVQVLFDCETIGM